MTQDIENTTSYEGDAISAGVSIGNTTGKPQATMNCIGYGTDSSTDPCRQIRITKLGRFLSRRLTVNQTTSGLAIGSPTLIMKKWDKILED